MAYTKYSLTPANNNAAPPDGAPEGMLPSAVNDTMRDMMAQIRDCGDGIRGGTYTMTAPVITGGSITGAALSGNTLTSPVITGGSINNTPIGASTANTGAFTTLSASSTATLNTLVSSGATITGGSVNNVPIGASTASTGAFTSLSASGAFSANGGATLGDASGDALTINSSAVSIPNGLNFDSNTFVIDATNNFVGVGTSSPSQKLVVAQGTKATTAAVTNIAGFQTTDASTFGLYVRQKLDATAANRWMGLTSFDNGVGAAPLILQDFGGAVGIGTTTPIYTLDVAATTTAGGIVRWNASGGVAGMLYSSATQAAVLDSGTGQNGLGIVPATNYVYLATAGLERMRIDSTGNLLLGTSTNNTGLASATKQIIYGSTATDGSGAYPATLSIIDDRAYNSTSPSAGGGIAFGYKYSSGGLIALGSSIQGFKENTTDGNYASALKFFTRPNGTSPTERMRIDSSGNLSIGTTASQGRLTVSSNSGTTILTSFTNSALGTSIGNGGTITISQFFGGGPVYSGTLYLTVLGGGGADSFNNITRQYAVRFYTNTGVNNQVTLTALTAASAASGGQGGNMTDIVASCTGTNLRDLTITVTTSTTENRRFHAVFTGSVV